MNREFLERAIQLAVENVRSNAGGPFGAVITRGADIIAESANLVTATNDPTAHAEVSAIRRACAKLGTFELAGCEIYSSCEPCPMCLGAVYWARLDRVYFAASRSDAAAAGFDDELLYMELPKPCEQRRLPAVHEALASALAPFDAWRESQGKIAY